ncbi:MAG: OsmC family protein [Deltaproteobacteria bacterium]|nr:OsmC family protein [Deltaproteobacteria bacterium]
MSEKTGQKVGEFALRVERLNDFEFKVSFDKEHYAPLHLDEPAPLGKDRAPNPARILAAAIGDCLSASLLFCMKKNGADVSALTSDVNVELVRNENNRLRIGKVSVTLRPGISSGDATLQKCLGMFEDFCVVTQSVRDGLDVEVKVEPQA